MYSKANEHDTNNQDGNGKILQVVLPPIHAHTHTYTQNTKFPGFSLTNHFPGQDMFLGYRIVLKHASAGKNLNLQACMIFFTLKLELYKNLSEEYKQINVYKTLIRPAVTYGA